MTLEVAIVGHGPSLQKMRMGKQIDEHDIVIRFKWHSELTNFAYVWGKRTDIVCCSMVVAPKVKQHWPKTDRFFIFSDSRTQDKTNAECNAVIEAFKPDVAVLDKPLCDFWDRRYRDAMGSDEIARGPHTNRDNGDGAEPHTSAGFHCLMYVGKYLSPSKVSLFGFDSMATGEWTWSVTRGPDWQKYPNHRFDIESRLMHDLSAAYMMDIQAYLPGVSNVGE